MPAFNLSRRYRKPKHQYKNKCKKPFKDKLHLFSKVFSKKLRVMVVKINSLILAARARK